MGQTTRKSSTEAFIETGVVQAIETSLREGHVCQPSLLIIPMLSHSQFNISFIKNPYADDRDAELDPEQYLMRMLCRWDVVLCLEYCAFEVVD